MLRNPITLVTQPVTRTINPVTQPAKLPLCLTIERLYMLPTSGNEMYQLLGPEFPPVLHKSLPAIQRSLPVLQS